jgi:hypothetical protein
MPFSVLTAALGTQTLQHCHLSIATVHVFLTTLFSASAKVE